MTKIYSCDKCGNNHYKQVEQCQFCDSTVLIETEGTEEEVLLIILFEISTESKEYEDFDYDSIVELVIEKLGKENYDKYKYLSLVNALKMACNKGYFTETTTWVSST